jgi:hypothetical protein
MSINQTKRKRELNMSFSGKLKILREIMKKGGWEDERALMGEALFSSPPTFSGLRPSHADDCIAYGNSRLIDMGLEPVGIRPEDDPGRCEDIWDEGPRVFVTNKRRWSAPSKKLAGIKMHEIDFLDEAIAPPEELGGVVSESYLSDVEIGDFNSQVTWVEDNNGEPEKYPAEEFDLGPSPKVSELGKRIREQKEFDKRVADVERREREVEYSLRAIDDMAKAKGLLCEEPEDDI